MSNGAENDRRRAAELAADARAHETRGEYREARRYYEQSLALCENEAVRQAYLRLMATIGPK